MDGQNRLVFSDCPERSETFFESPLLWKKSTSMALGQADRALCELLLPRGEGWVATAPGVDRFWSRFVVVEDAPASQFDALQQVYRAKWHYPGAVTCVALRGKNFTARGRPWASCEGNLHFRNTFELRA